MPTFKDAIRDVSRCMQFENWIRFYFTREENDALYVRVPEEAVSKISENYPEYSKLVEGLNNNVLEYSTAMSNICTYVVSAYDSTKYKEGTVPRVFDSNDFQLEMHLFNVWTQAHEAQLDENFYEFDKWMEFYEEWKQTPEVKAQLDKTMKKMRKVKACTAANKTDKLQ